jgi:hypothetical protein
MAPGHSGGANREANDGDNVLTCTEVARVLPPPRI